jgi:SnoaL-like polyketide cyclase
VARRLAAASLLCALLAGAGGLAPGAALAPPTPSPAAGSAAGGRPAVATAPATTATPPGAAATPPAGAAPAAATPAAAPDRRRESKLLVRRYLVEVLGAGRIDKLDEIVAKTFVDRTPGAPDLRGPAAARLAQKKLRQLFSKVEYNPQELIAEDDRVAARYLMTATPRPEPGSPQPPPLLLNGVALFRVRGGRIEEVFVLNDQVGLLRQLGYTLVPPGAGAGPPAPAPGGGASPPVPPSGPPPAPLPPSRPSPPRDDAR